MTDHDTSGARAEPPGDHEWIDADDRPDGLAAPLHRLLAHVIDYAGLFPPSKLPMDRAVRDYAGFLGGAGDWIVDRFVVPVARLDEFETAAASHMPTDEMYEPWRISALAAAAGDEGFERDLDRIARFNDTHAEASAGLAVIDAIELRAADATAIDGALASLDETLFAFFELPPGKDLRGLVAALAGSEAGAKIRTGGVTPDLYPDAGAVARFLVTCASAAVPIKATAGLHHPLHHRNETVGADEFGFLNVLVAAALAFLADAPAETLERVLVESDPSSLRVDETTLSFAGHSLSIDEIDDARLTFMTTFGSCSVDEPIEDLRSLGLLAAGG